MYQLEILIIKFAILIYLMIIMYKKNFNMFLEICWS